MSAGSAKAGMRQRGREERVGVRQRRSSSRRARPAGARVRVLRTVQAYASVQDEMRCPARAGVRQAQRVQNDRQLTRGACKARVVTCECSSKMI